MFAMASGLTYSRKSTSAEATKQLASTLAPYVRPGDVVLLSGDLGAGKTQFVQGIAKALGVSYQVTSPTFNIMISYDTQECIPLNHFDLYRLEHVDELEDIGYFDILDGEGVSFVEWGEKFPNGLPSSYIEVSISIQDDSARLFRARAFGDRARQLLFLWASDSKSRLAKCG